MDILDLKQFLCSDNQYRPYGIWIWNSGITEEIIESQVKDIHKKGLQGILIQHASNSFRPEDFNESSPIEYLSEKHLMLLKTAEEKAKQYGLKTGIIDADGWPSGKITGEHDFDRKVIASYHQIKRKRGWKKALTWWAKNLFKTCFITGAEFPHVKNPLDLLDEKASKEYIRLTHERYAAAGFTPSLIYNDESGFVDRYGFFPWTDELKEFEPYLAVLCKPVKKPDEKTADIRFRFWDKVTDLFVDNYFKQVKRWCKDNYAEFSGHLPGDDNLENHLEHFGHFFKIARKFDKPSIDVVGNQIFPGKKDNPQFPKLASSAAHINGTNIASSESFAIGGYGMSFDDMRFIADYQFVRGINELLIMGLYSSTDGPRKYFTMSNYFEGNPLWEHFREFSDYIGRICYMLQQGKPAIKAAVYYPITSIWMNPEKTKEISSAFEETMRKLLEAQIDFDIVDDLAITEKAGEYDFLVIPQHTILRDSTPYDRFRKIYNGNISDVIKEIKKNHSLDFVLTTPNPSIRYCHRKTDDADVYFITNESSEPADIDVLLEGKGHASIWDNENGRAYGECKDLEDKVRANVKLNSYSSTFVVVSPCLLVSNAKSLPDFRKYNKHHFRDFEAEVVKSYVINDGKIEVKKDGKIGPDFSGTIEYRLKFDIPYGCDCEKDMYLELKDIRFVAEAELNGYNLGKRIFSPYIFDVTGKIGEQNELKVRVTNSLANQILREDVMKAEEKWFSCYVGNTTEHDKKAVQDVLRCISLIYHKT